jgi:galactitol-specific phosphotransferase system IIB component
VIKIFLVEQLYTRLKLNKNVVQSFANKLNSNDIIIINKSLKRSFTELKKIYNGNELQKIN